MKTKEITRLLPASFFLAVAMTIFVIVSQASAAQPLRVVTTLSTFADLVKQVGGDDVEVAYVAPPKFNPHFIEARPSDVLKIKKADLFVHAGLDLEAWRDPLLDAAGNPNAFPGQSGSLDLSKGIALLEVPDKPLNRLMGDIHLYGNPHYWLDPENGRLMAKTICDKLCEMDPAHCDPYHARLESFLKKLDQKETEWKPLLAVLHGKELLAYHNEWPYLASYAGFETRQFLEPKPGIPPSPKQLAFLQNYIAQKQIKAIIQPTYYPKDNSGRLAQRTGARLVVICQNVGELPQASDYLLMIDYDLRQIAATMEAKP